MMNKCDYAHKSCAGCIHEFKPITSEPCYRCERILTEAGNYEDCYRRKECLCYSCKFAIYITSKEIFGCNVYSTAISGEYKHCKFYVKKGMNNEDTNK